jgi:hypothetical protein
MSYCTMMMMMIHKLYVQSNLRGRGVGGGDDTWGMSKLQKSLSPKHETLTLITEPLMTSAKDQ